jgi:RNA polymerase sigma factor (sigma-70 family)
LVFLTSKYYKNRMDLLSPENVKTLVERCAKQDRDAQQALYKSMYSKMLTICYRYSRRPEEAKDLLQDGFIKVFKKIEKFTFNGSLEGWIRRIMVNNAIDYYRLNKNKFAMSEVYLVEDQLSEIEDEEEEIEPEIDGKEILACIQELSPGYRAVFNLYVLDNYSHAEIAEKLNISEGTSKSNLAKAKRNLRKLLQEKIK